MTLTHKGKRRMEQLTAERTRTTGAVSSAYWYDRSFRQHLRKKNYTNDKDAYHRDKVHLLPPNHGRSYRFYAQLFTTAIGRTE